MNRQMTYRSYTQSPLHLGMTRPHRCCTELIICPLVNIAEERLLFVWQVLSIFLKLEWSRKKMNNNLSKMVIICSEFIKGVLHLLCQNYHVLCSIWKLSTPCWKIIYVSYKKLPKELKNGIEILVGRKVFKLWIKTIKMLFGSITQEPLGLSKFGCCFWVPYTIYYIGCTLLLLKRC